MIKVLLVDNYDSFTYNLVHDLRSIGNMQLEVGYNDKLQLEDVDQYDKIIISPGPGLPKDNGIITALIQSFYNQKPILGVCLGLQAIYECFGGSLINLPRVHHGVSSRVWIKEEAQDDIFKDVPNPFFAGRYHSWVCDPRSFPDNLRLTAVDEEGTIMACCHQDFPVHGIQFHPESFLTPEGKKMLANFIKI